MSAKATTEPTEAQMPVAEARSKFTCLAALALMMILISFNLGYHHGTRDRDKIWCDAMKSAGIAEWKICKE